jgi:hypothetical protein
VVVVVVRVAPTHPRGLHPIDHFIRPDTGSGILTNVELAFARNGTALLRELLDGQELRAADNE